MKPLNLLQPFDCVRTMLAICGMWNTGKTWKFLQVLHVLGTFGIFGFGFLISSALQLKHANSMDDISTGLYLTLSMVNILIRFSNFLVNRRKFLTCLADLGSPVVKPTTTDEIAVFLKFFSRFNALRSVFFVLAYGITLGGCLNSILSEGKELPLGGWFPFDWENNNYFWIIFTYQTIAGFYTASVNVCLNLSHGFLLRQLSAYYRLISMRVQKIGYIRSESKLLMNSQYSTKDLIKCIQMHQFVERISQSVEDIVKLPIFIQICLSGIIICLTAVQLTLFSPMSQTGLFLSTLCYLVALAIQISIYCYYGNEITVESEFISTALYSSNWTELSQQYRKQILCYMILLKKPKVIVVGGYLRVELETLRMVFKGAYSLFALVKNV